MSLEWCSRYCEGYGYARFMVHRRNRCACLGALDALAHSNSTVGAVDGESCRLECQGRTEQICGDWSYGSLYSVANVSSISNGACAFEFSTMATPVIYSAVVVGTALELVGIGLAGTALPTVTVGSETLVISHHNATHITSWAPRCPGTVDVVVGVHVPGVGYALSGGIRLDLSRASNGYGHLHTDGHPACAPPPPPVQPPLPPPPLAPFPSFSPPSSGELLPSSIHVANWSSPDAWGGQPPPLADSTAIIPVGVRVLLDVSPPPLFLLLVQGHLEFARVDGLHLQARYIFVAQNASFTVGTAAMPFLQTATITMIGASLPPPFRLPCSEQWRTCLRLCTGTPLSEEIPVYGAKMLACRECTLDLHGKPTLRSWTRLAATAPAGTTELRLLEPVDWDLGSQIVVASTSAEMEEAEVGTVAAVGVGGLSVTLDTPLAYTHQGQTVNIAGYDVELRAEVGLLSRNVVFQGDAESVPTQYGAHIMMHSNGDESLAGRFSNVEVRFAGQAFRLGRYPIHFHMIGEVTNSYVRSCSIHHTYNRAVTMHGVHRLRVEDNVAYDTMGHTYFLEDGVETKNEIVHNLGVLTRASLALLSTDATPATFWITNADNVLVGNAAAGSANYGFWINPEPHVTGASVGTPFATGVCPQGTPLLNFTDNVRAPPDHL